MRQKIMRKWINANKLTKAFDDGEFEDENQRQ